MDGDGVEIWGWEERERVERLSERFLRRVLGVESRTPEYMVRKKLQREKMRSRAVRGAWGFERKLEEGSEGELTVECMKELRKRAENGGRLSDWEKERERFF